jgi:vancomycin resistance protein VanJ
LITVRCSCGEVFHADEQHAGRRLRCRCGKLVEIEIPTPAAAPSPVAAPASARPPTATRRRARTSGVRSLLARWPAAGPRYRRPLEIASFAYLAVAILASALLWRFSDEWWPATLLLFAGRWVLLLPLALLAPAALLFQRRLLLPLLAALLLVLGPVMGLHTGLRIPPRGIGDAPRLRVVSFNSAETDAVADRLDELLATWRPDVVAFQECGPALARAVREVPGWHAREDRSLCILSRYPILAAAPMDREALEHIHQTTSIGGAGWVVRYALRTEHGVVDLVNLHLETPRKGIDALVSGDLATLRANTTLRAVESRLAREWVARSTRPTIVAGDFNMPVESRIFQRSWGDLDDAFSEAGRGFGWTRFNGWIRARIDHVLTTRHWWAESARVGADAGSDHRPLIVDLRLRRER